MTEDNIIKLIIGILGLLGTIFGAVFGYISRSKKQAVIDAKREQEQSDNFARLFLEMDGIKKRLDVHNKYAEKFMSILKSLTEPVYKKVRQKVPPVSGYDIAPYVLLLLILFVGSFISRMSQWIEQYM